ncbi:hypothetical protein L4D09_14730 [Photobacterium makurazakiensis]|uniref:hypothetical protein n=1 Tax=Photobacterium makurazakiensis TaxID=2910234 RepID=UPI003D0B3741
MMTGSPVEQAKLHRMMIVDALGFCYILLPCGQNLDRKLGMREYRFKDKYWARLLLQSHHNRWGYRFELRKLYLSVLPCPLIHHKSDQTILNELSDRIACGDLWVYKVNHLLSLSSSPSPDTHSTID